LGLLPGKNDRKVYHTHRELLRVLCPHEREKEDCLTKHCGKEILTKVIRKPARALVLLA